MRPRFAESGLPPLHYVGRLRDAPPVWLESRGPFEYLRLRRHEVLAGGGVPRGDGRPVLLVPGFLAGDSSLVTMHDWLLRIGYHAEGSGIVFNVRFSEAVVQTVTLRLVDLFAWHGRKVTLVGHSRGGMVAKVVAHRHPQMVERVIALGSPLADPYDLHPVTMAGVRLAQVLNLVRFGRTADVERRFLLDLAAPATVPLASVYSRSDGIVHWEACLRPDAACVEVDGSHVGLAVNPDVYAVLGRLLAGRDGGPGRGSR
jgi:triacylglycerol lipase